MGREERDRQTDRHRDRSLGTKAQKKAVTEHPCDKRGYRVTSAGGSWRGRLLLRATPWGWHSRRHLSVPCRGGAGVRPSPEATEAEPRSSRAVAQRCPKVWECMSHVLKSGDRREAPDFSFPFLKKRKAWKRWTLTATGQAWAGSGSCL